MWFNINAGNDVGSFRRISTFWLVSENSIIYKKKVGSKIGLFDMFSFRRERVWLVENVEIFFFNFLFLLGCAIPCADD